MVRRIARLGLGPLPAAAGDPVRALEFASPESPYLARLFRQQEAVLSALRESGPDSALGAIQASMRMGPLEEVGIEAAMSRMRRLKEGAHLVVAGADLSGVWTLDQVVASLTYLADAAVQTALKIAVRSAWASGRFGEVRDSDDLPGLFILAMGKMGARELNYSSDIDLIVLFDLDVVPIPKARVKEAMVRLTRDLVRLLEERTVDGYVFRTDLRLRPDPASTAPAISTQFALSYYESVGQNWERMAHIKARVCAGDRKAGAAYLDALAPFIWRRYLDYAAIADIHSIKRQIHAHGRHAALTSADFDVKLGRGGIREIEFFTQVQQLIMGGRKPAIRASGTKAALAALTEAGMTPREMRDELLTAYDFLRAVEHRIQMVNDEQTHHLPDIPEKRSQIARLSGYVREEDFEVDITRVRNRVHGAYSDLFAQEEQLAGKGGNLMFTGVDEDPGTVQTLREMGFSDPSRVIRTIQAWHRGGTPATRSARGRQLLTTLGPRLLTTMSEIGQPDLAFERFAAFFGALPAGVQTLSMMLAEPAMTRDLIATMAFAPKLATDLARRPALLDAMLEPRFSVPVSREPDGQRETMLRALIARGEDFEGQLNIARRFHREESFRIGYQLLRGTIRANEAGAAYADLADACVSALADAAEAEVLARFEGTIGRWAVCALGKFGGRELSASSDLDLMLIYERDETAPGDSLAPRFVQRLIAALSAPTEEGLLYEVDTQLRPSGRAGPVAVQFSSFERYYEGEAWTWEFMALTRLRPVAGDPGLRHRITDAVRRALKRKSADPAIVDDVADMRRRMARERPARSHWDLKLAPGGLVDVEFVIQCEILRAAGEAPEVSDPASLWAIHALRAAGRLSAEEAGILERGLVLQLDLQQALRIAAGDGFDPATASPALKAWLAAHLGEASFEALEEDLLARQKAVSDLRSRRVGPLGGEAAASEVSQTS
ncbi:MAG: bifunctional [glutamine synthetase] adenylyltransferase/[glutamine synthetase]-adenylyl-L-tyrosine phosphorylase [Alphaproteobacteria bacterium]|nr:bifunctional [glutamine synthetase] adenylyltransferase/[glutamine synthetase]-adenylyl-L-tyrosine phosphorylase [Alphaproteobacteria bacterium]